VRNNWLLARILIFSLFLTSLLWMNFASGYVTYFADTFKFVPGLSLFTLAALLLFLDYQESTCFSQYSPQYSGIMATMKSY